MPFVLQLPFDFVHFAFLFLDAQPTDGEREVWNQISAVLQDSESMLADLQAYKGAGQEIRDVCLIMTVLWKQNQAKLDVFLGFCSLSKHIL